MTAAPTEAQIRAALLDLALRRGSGRSFCPSEVARVLDASRWRDLMPAVRRVAAAMPEIRATQAGLDVQADAARGPIRLFLRP